MSDEKLMPFSLYEFVDLSKQETSSAMRPYKFLHSIQVAILCDTMPLDSENHLCHSSSHEDACQRAY